MANNAERWRQSGDHRFFAHWARARLLANPMEGVMTNVVPIEPEETEVDGLAESISRQYEAALTSREARSCLYDIAADAFLAFLAVSYLEENENERERESGLIAIRRTLKQINDALLGIAGGHTFERFDTLEAGEPWPRKAQS